MKKFCYSLVFKSISIFICLFVFCNTATYGQNSPEPYSPPPPPPPLLVEDSLNYEAEFVTGSSGWKRFLEANLNTEVPIKKKAPKGLYKVKIRFIVDLDGSIYDVMAVTNVGYGLEKEAIRVIKKSNKMWKPGMLNGKLVKAYRTQPISFMVD